MINLENSDNFKSWDEWERMKKAHYGTKTGFQMIGGIIDFDPDKQKDLVGGDKLTYDEYLDLQLISCESKEKARGSFALCYYYIPLEFDGQIEKSQIGRFVSKGSLSVACMMTECASTEKKTMFGCPKKGLKIIKSVTA